MWSLFASFGQLARSPGCRWLSCAALTFTIFSTSGLAQPGLIDFQYGPLDLLRVAPGQVIRLRLSGIGPLAGTTVGPLVSVRRPASFPLPTEFEDLSFHLTTYGVTGDSKTQLLPIHEIVQNWRCRQVGLTRPECWVTTATIQVPYDLPVDSSLQPIAPNPSLTVKYRGLESAAFTLQPRTMEIHIATDCDKSGLGAPTDCYPLVYDSSGARVRTARAAAIEADPRTDRVHADPRAAIIVYAYGLGSVDSPEPLPTNQPTPNGLFPIMNPIRVSLSWVDAGTGIGPTQLAPDFVGLAPGGAGLYQLNLRLPEPPRGLPKCGGLVTHNAVVTITDRARSVDAVRICVEPAPATAP